VLSAFPLVLHGLGVPAPWTWRLASGIVVVWSIAGITFSARRRGRDGMLPTIKRHWIGATIVYLLFGISLALALSNLLSPSSFSGGRHVAWALAALTQAGTMFILAVFDLRWDTPSA